MGASSEAPPSKYKPRENDGVRQRALAAHIERLRKTKGYFTTTVRREDTVREFLDCPHTEGRVFEVENAHGEWAVVICVNCGQQIHKECPHVSSTWNEAGTLLTCDNCGIDGT